jgi:hypothetical protein
MVADWREETKSAGVGPVASPENPEFASAFARRYHEGHGAPRRCTKSACAQTAGAIGETANNASPLGADRFVIRLRAPSWCFVVFVVKSCLRGTDAQRRNGDDLETALPACPIVLGLAGSTRSTQAISTAGNPSLLFD